MNKWIPISICGMIILAATGCSTKEAGQATNSPSVVASTPTPAATAAATPSPVATATVAVSATAVPTASASPAASASATPQPQVAATPTPTQPTPAPASATPAPTVLAPTPTPSASAKPQPTVSATSNSAAKAELLYKSNCLSCHGAGLTGDYGPNLTKVGSRKTKEQIVTQIMNGKIEMPPFKDSLKADEVEALASWLAAMK